MPNILSAISSIVKSPVVEIVAHYKGLNRVNNIGDSLETYIKDLISNSIDIENEIEIMEKYTETFSYSGNLNHPPDIILHNSDAFEIKKIQSRNADLALNSSYPKSKLYSTDPMITESCRKCEDWDEKDIVYVIGYIEKGTNLLKSICFIYGDCYAASREIYQSVRNRITNGIKEIPNVDHSESDELGRINKVDPLGITNLRIRGMWQILNPFKVFNYLYTYNKKLSFQVLCVMRSDKFDSFPEDDKKNLSSIDKEGFKISDVKIKDPDNPVKMLDAKLITYQMI